MAMGIIPPTDKRMDAPCCDVFRLVNGKIQSFNCYPSGTVIMAQLVRSALEPRGRGQALVGGWQELYDAH